MNYSIIAAISDNFVIGYNNTIPWHISEDLKLFKKLTLGNTVIMGRKTYQSIGKPLPGRTTIVVSASDEIRQALGEAGIKVCTSLDSALSLAAEEAGEIFVAGGASIYAQAIGGAQKLYISKVPGKYEGDTFFPAITESEWNLASTEAHSEFTLEVYSRIPQPGAITQD